MGTVLNVSTSLTTELYPSKYRLLGLVGQGQFGRVYCASQRKTGALVALKELDRQRFSTQKFLRELRFLMLLRHPNIVACRALEHTQTSRYLVMDYCEAGTLRNLLDEEVRLHPMQGLSLLTQVLDGLEHAHQRGIVHCDIKPENILLTAIADGWTARISDFGIARLSQELFEEFSNTGSPAYMAPERFYGQYSPASDLYAIGILLYELLVGHRPFSGAPGELMSAHLNQALQIPDTVPADLKTVIATALQKLPARRFRSAAEMRVCLQTAIAHAEPELSSGWATPALLRPGQPPTSVPFRFIDQEPLQTRIQQLVSCDRPCSLFKNRLGEQHRHQTDSPTSEESELAVFRVASQSIRYQTFTVTPADLAPAEQPLLIEESSAAAPDGAIASSPPPWPTVYLPEPVLDLAIRPQGCFAVTEKAIYFLTPDLFVNQLGRHEVRGARHEADGTVDERSSALLPQLLIALPQKAQVAIDPAGKWIAAVTSHANQGSQLNLWNFKPSLPFRPAIVRSITPCFQILALDSRHIVTFSHVTDGEACITGVRLEGFTRRGTPLGTLQLPIPLQQVNLTATPYRLLALEPRHSNSILILDLKPLRIQRAGLDIAPKYLVATTWGLLLMATDGQIVLLNNYGQLIGGIHGPAHPTAIAPLSPYEFLIATWHQDHGSLYRVDLRQLDLDVVF